MSCTCKIPRLEERLRIAQGGYWFTRFQCKGCWNWVVSVDVKVDQNDQDDCEAADASQGIV